MSPPHARPYPGVMESPEPSPPAPAALYRCFRHPDVQVVLYLQATLYCARCGRCLRLVGNAPPLQPELFGEAPR